MTQLIETRWWLVRHGPIEAAHSGKINGRLDVGVDLSDTDQVARLAQALPVDAVWVTSALGRTQTTAKAIGARDFHIEPDLNEQNFGDWQGLTWGALAERDDAVLFWEAPATTQPPGGETFSNQVVRVGAVMDRLSAEYAGRDIIAVVHAGVIRAGLAHALGIDAGAALGFQVDTLSLNRMEHFTARPSGSRGGNWRVSAVNRTFRAGS